MTTRHSRMRLNPDHGMQRLLNIAAGSYAALLIFALALLECGADRHWLPTVLLFAPPQFLLLPALALIPASILLRHWRILALQIGCMALVLGGYMHLRFRTPQAPDAAALTLLSHNAGEGNRAQFAEFAAAEAPDVILLQDARNRGPEFERRYPDYYVAARGEFVCASRYLIQQARVLDQPNWHLHPVMARYEIVREGQPLVLYSVHLPTPRNQLSRFLGTRSALAMFGNEELPGGHATLREWNASRAELYQKVAEVFAREQAPYIVAGDFNMPDHGPLYRGFCKMLTDAFAERGSGFGFTFPGGMRSIAALLGPWLRIDYIFAGRGWTPLSCQPEPGLLSQHRAVVARLKRQ
jgi:vancomycin resistance protein VanJ